MVQAELLEVRRLRAVLLVLRKMCRQKALHTLVSDLRRQPEGVGLKRVARVDAVRPNHASPLDLQVIGANPLQHLGSQRLVLQVQQVPGTVEAKTAVFEGHGVAARLSQLFENSILDASPPELDRRTQPSEASP